MTNTCTLPAGHLSKEPCNAPIPKADCIDHGFVLERGHEVDCAFHYGKPCDCSQHPKARTMEGIIGKSAGVRVNHPDDDPAKIKPFVIVESPFMGLKDVRGIGPGTQAYNIRYARAAIRDSILRGEAPFASHLLYTQDGILRDEVHEERELGMGLGWHIMRRANLVTIYTDLGWSSGMVRGFNAAVDAGKSQPEIRRLGGEWNATPPDAYAAVGFGDWQDVIIRDEANPDSEVHGSYVIEADLVKRYAVIWKEIEPGRRHAAVIRADGLKIIREKV